MSLLGILTFALDDVGRVRELLNLGTLVVGEPSVSSPSSARSCSASSLRAPLWQ